MKIFDEYKSMMERVDPPDYLDDKVVKTVNALRETKTGNTRPHVYGKKQTRGNSSKRCRPYLFPGIAAGMVAASLIVGAIIALPSVLTKQDGESSSQELSAQTVPSIFGLALYADASEPGQTLSIATDESGISPHGETGAPRPIALQYLINLKCVGESIDTVTYRLEGEDVRFEIIEMQNIEYDDSLHPKTYTYPEEITVDYDEQHSDYYLQRIDVDTRTAEQREFDILKEYSLLEEQLQATNDPNEQNRIRGEIDKLGEDQTRRNNEEYENLPEDPEELAEVLNELYRSAVLDAAQKIGQSTLSVTATFLDGSTATKQYKITPVDNLEQVLLDREAATAQYSENPELLDADPRMTAPLFTITEVG